MSDIQINDTIDVRTIPPRERHPLIFNTFERLQSGEAFILINDHAPEPLYHQFKNTRKGQFTWDYIEQGPEVWRVRIGKAEPSAQSYTYLENLNGMVSIAEESIVSRTVFKSNSIQEIVFGFAAGQSLSEHTSSQTAIIHILDGEAVITLGQDSFNATAGAWIHMPPNLAHSVVAKTPLIMSLLMIK